MPRTTRAAPITARRRSPGHPLAYIAQRRADHLRKANCGFDHSGGEYGENLAAATTGSMSPMGVVDMWYAEVAQFDFVHGGFSMDTGHFTQLVWRGTTQVGCGTTTCNDMQIWVCNYDPSGNYEGEFRTNVLPEVLQEIVFTGAPAQEPHTTPTRASSSPVRRVRFTLHRDETHPRAGPHRCRWRSRP